MHFMGNNLSKISGFYLFSALIFSLMLSSSKIYAETQFFDDFTGNAVNKSMWLYPVGDPSFYGRTQIRAKFPSVSDGLLHLQLDTYNPTGYSFYGSEIITRNEFTSGTGLAVEFKAKLVTPIKGLVGGLFLYNFFGSLHSEIDFELLSNLLPDTIQTNIYANEPLGAGHPTEVKIPGVDMTQFNNYRIEWFPDRVRWLVNNMLIRENSTLVPQAPLALHLNFYVPSCDWVTACDANLVPATRPEDNKTYFFDIDWVRVVSQLNPETECLFSWAERNHTDLFAPANSATQVWSVYTYRYYAKTDSYLGVSSADNHVYYISRSGSPLQDVGALSYWLPIAGCQGAKGPPANL